MNHPQSPERIVVGIDGSDAAINAAKWGPPVLPGPKAR